MEMIYIRTCALFFIVSGLFCLTEGKACPERVRPHKTRCEMYYKCMELATQRHVWIPENCEKGLVFENDLKMCVLPGDDWECMLGEQPTEISTTRNEHKQYAPPVLNKKSDIYIVSNGNEESKFSTDDGTVEVVLRSDISSEEEDDDERNIVEASGDGVDLSDGFLNAANRETLDAMPDEKMGQLDVASSTAATTTVDPNLTAHLQRLSQLIDGLKQTYQNRDKEQAEMGPDQLNAFLAHFNIRNKFDSIDTEEMHGNYKHSEASSTPATFISSQAFSNVSDLTKETFDMEANQTVPHESSFLSKLKPETKVVLTSSAPKRYSSAGYSNSQIVVNRPEGSVLFSLPPYGAEGHFVEHTNTHSVQQFEHNIPKISEETLKTVLELSKQMIANQNVPNVLPNPAYYAQPIIQPLFLPPYAPRPSSVNSPFSSYYGNPSMMNAEYENHANGYGKPPMLSYHKPHFVNKKPQKQSGTTIIHNNVIPVHVTSTNSGEKEVVDSYGQSLGLYPPLADAGNNKNPYTFQVTHQYENNKFVTTVRPFVSTTPAGQYSSAQYPPPYSPDHSATTVRPPLQFQPTPATVAEYYTPSPHLSENNVNSIFRPPERYPDMQYASIPRPMDPNRPDGQYQQMERPSSYQSLSNNSPFPPQIDPNKVKIRPNSQKVESMEADDDVNSNDASAFSGYAGASNFNKKPQIDPQSYDPPAPFINQASPVSGYSPGSYQNPYMPRPSQSNQLGNFGHGVHKPKFPNYNEGAQLVNIGGNFISYDAFQNNILPLIGPTGSVSSSSSNIEVISCQTGVRQPNMTDCTRYYVCSKKDGKVLSYSCPPYTAFNPQSRICDARSYANCSPDAIISSYTVSENKRIQMEAMQALNEAKKRQEEAMKAQKLANLLQQYNSQLGAQQNYQMQSVNELDSASNANMLNSYVQQAAMSAISANPTTAKPPKKRKYYCKEGDKVPDQTSIYNYFVCYKNAEGMMKGRKMTCLKGLLFCPATTSCTLPAKCT